MTTWSEDEEIVCVHPNGTRHVGYDAVRQSFEQLFAGEGKLGFRLEELVSMETVGLAMQSAMEHVHSTQGDVRGVVIATNVFMRTPTGWRMVLHHASPAPPVAVNVPAGPLH
jgi:ketosteroid isomerase-like protein